MNKPKAPAVAAPVAATAPEPPRQTADTAAEAGVPAVTQAPEPEPTPEEREKQAAQEALADKEGFARFLRNAFNDEEFSQMMEMMQAEAAHRGLTTKAPEVEQPSTETPAADPHAAAREAMAAAGITKAYVLADGSWRFSEAFALKAAGDNPDSITVIEA